MVGAWLLAVGAWLFANHLRHDAKRQAPTINH
jgi:hypothetical protein